jgi:hypothetical protein
MPVRIPFLATFLVHGSTHGRSPAARARWEPALLAPLGVVTAGTHLRREPFGSPDRRFIVLPAPNVKDGPRRRTRNRGARAFRDAPCPGAWLLRAGETASRRRPAPQAPFSTGTQGRSWRKEAKAVRGQPAPASRRRGERRDREPERTPQLRRRAAAHPSPRLVQAASPAAIASRLRRKRAKSRRRNGVPAESSAHPSASSPASVARVSRSR